MHEEEETLEFAAGGNPPINCTIPGKVGLLYQRLFPKKNFLKADGLKYSPDSFRFMFFSLFFVAILQNSFKGLEPQRNDFVLFNPNFGAEIFDGVKDTARTKSYDFLQFEM